MNPTEVEANEAKQSGVISQVSNEDNKQLGDTKVKQNGLENIATQSIGTAKSEVCDSNTNYNIQYITERRDIILENDINNQRYCMPSIEVKFISDGSLYFSDLIDRLKEMKFPLDNCMLFWWDEKRGMHVFVANDPILQPLFLPPQSFGIQKNIYIKFRSYQQPLHESVSVNQTSATNANGSSNGVSSQMVKEEDQMMSEDNYSNLGDNTNNNNNVGSSGQQKKKKKLMNMMMGSNTNISSNNLNNMRNNINDKRVKERYIEKVREKVGEWRAMHETGFRDKDGNLQKINLDQAANIIGISRKTLDDYYLQLRRAEQLGFDFERNKSEKMGTLRKFVKEETKRQPKKGNNLNSLMNNNLFNQSVADSDEDDQSSPSFTSIQKQILNNNNNNNNNNLINMLNNHSHNSSNHNSNNMNSIGHKMNSIGSNHNSNNNNNSNNLVNILMNSSNNNNNNMNSIGSNNSNNSVHILSKNSIHSLIGSSNPNPLMSISQQNQYYQQQMNNQNGTSAILTPYNYNAQQFGYSSGGFYNNNSNLQNNNNGNNSNISANNNSNNHHPMSAYHSRGSYMVPENLLSSGLDNSINNIGQQNSNISQPNNIQQNRNSASLFNPGSQFLSLNHQFSECGILSQELEGSNILNANNANNNNNATEQRFSNHFQIMQLGNSSQIMEERNSFTFLNNSNRNTNNIADNINPSNNGNGEGQSNSQLFQLSDITQNQNGVSQLLNS